MDITEFIAARLDDRQRYAERAASATADADVLGAPGWAAAALGSDGGNASISTFVGCWSPDDVLRHVASQRELLRIAEMLRIRRTDGGSDPDELDRPAGLMLRALAAPDAEHKDFNPAWALS